MTSGTIKRLNDRGFGFISPSNGSTQDVFFHSTSVQGITFDQLREGMTVSFEEEADPRDPSRQRARTVSAATDSGE